MKRFALLSQAILAVVLTVLWLRWNPLSPECPDGVDCDPPFDPFTSTRREPSRAVEVGPAPSPFEVEFGRCAMVMRLPRGHGIECLYEPGSTLRLWVVHRRVDEASIRVMASPGPPRWMPSPRSRDRDSPSSCPMMGRGG